MLSTPPAFILSQDQTLHKSFSKKQGREKPETQPKTNHPTPPHQKDGDAELAQKFQKLQGSKNNRPLTRRGKTGPITNTRVKSMSTTPQHALNQTDDAISYWNSTTPPPAHTHNRAHTTQCTKQGRQTHPRNKSTLAHYRVLKQHQHTHQPDHHSPASQAASLQATHNINQKSNSRSTTVYPAVTLCSFTIPPDQPLGPLRSNGWIYNHEP